VPGDGNFIAPKNVGLPFGTHGTKGLKMEVHYNNPSQFSGMANRSGVRLTFTRKLREHNAGSLVLGDPAVALQGVPIGQGWSKWDFNCPESCTDSFLDQNITVFANMLHMHEAGERMVFQQHNRKGELVQHEFVDTYDFTQAGGYWVPSDPFQVSSGDSFDVTCYYNEEQFGDNRTFGLASDDEMCMAFLWYYPRLPEFPGFCGAHLEQFVPGCGGNYTYTPLASESDVGRTFGIAGPACSTPADTLGSAAPADVSAAALLSLLPMSFFTMFIVLAVAPF